MTDQLYVRQEPLHLTIPRSVTVAGVGGIGAWCSIGMAMSGVPNLYLFDPDLLEESNRGRLPFCQSSLNKPKVDVVADYIRAIRPECNIVPIQEKLEGILLPIQLSTSNVVADFTDSPKAQITIYNACVKAGVTYLRAGYDGTHMTITSHISGWVNMEQEEVPYQTTPSWVGTCLVIAGLVLHKLEKLPGQEVSCDLSEIGIPAQRRTASRLSPRCRGTAVPTTAPMRCV